MVAYGTRRTQPSRQARADCPYAPAWAFEPEPEPAPRSHSRQGSHGAKNTDGHGRRPQQHRRRPNEEAERDENVWGLLVDDDEEIAAGRLVWDTEPLSHSPTSPSRLVAPPSPSRLGRDGNHTSGGARPASAPAARRRRARAAPEQGDPNDTGRVIPRAVRGGELKHLKKTTFFGRPADEIQPNPDEFLQKRTGRGSTGKPVPEKRKGGNGSRTIMKEAVPPNVARRRPRTAPRDHVKGHIEGDWAPVANQKLAHRSRIERSNKFQVKPGQIPKWLSQRKAEVARQRREEEAAAEEARERAAGRYRSAQPKPMPEEERTQLLAGLRAKVGRGREGCGILEGASTCMRYRCRHPIPST